MKKTVKIKKEMGIMLKKMLKLALMFILAVPSISLAKVVEDVNIPDTFMAGDQSLILNGAGTRTKFFIDAYIGSLYLVEKSKDGLSIVNSDKPMAINLHITSSMVTSEKMETAFREGFEESTGGKMEAISSEIEQIINAFKEPIQENDKFQMVYIPGIGVQVNKNGAQKTVVPGLAFKKALFGIWLGNEPADDDLKEDMLDED
jgi:hypothetical protein